MIPTMFSSGERAAVLAMAVSLFAAVPARAGSLPPRAEVGLTSGVEVDAFRRLVASRYHVEFRVVVAADVDRDGDLDVLAATDHSVTVWVNDGAGHLRAHRLPRGTAVEPHAAGNAWRGREDRVQPTIQCDGTHPQALSVHAHAPPASGIHASAGDPRAPAVASHDTPSSPRAPPV
jgi:FG-GAP-like repeat